MTEARIPLLSLEEARQAAKDAEIPEALAELNIFRALLHHPMLAGQLSGMLSAASPAMYPPTEPKLFVKVHV